MYNPINNIAGDEERLKEKDLRERNKKKRFEARTEIDKKQKEDGNNRSELNDQMKLTKISHMRVREELERGFDIVSNDREV